MRFCCRHGVIFWSVSFSFSLLKSPLNAAFRPEDFVTEEYRGYLVEETVDDEVEREAAASIGFLFPFGVLTAFGYAWYSKKTQIARSGRHKKIDTYY